jgi:hypothetical protein
MNGRVTKVTREELFRQVWETPMVHLAAQYGISGNGLAKICDRLKVPYPSRGYWAQKAAGKNVITYRLPTAEVGTPHEVMITPSVPVPKAPVEVQAKIEEIRSTLVAKPPSQRASRPHPIVAGWVEEHKRKTKEARGDRILWGIRPDPFSEFELRRHRILSVLFHAVEENGGKVREGERRLLFCKIQGEEIEIQLREKMKQVRRPLTDDEKSWKIYGEWRQELVPTGFCLFSIKSYQLSGLRTEWLESIERPTEQTIPEIIATLVAAGPILAEARRVRVEAERLSEIARQESYRESQRVKEDSNRWRKFVELAHQWRDVEISLAFLAALRAGDFDRGATVKDKTIAEWLDWIDQHAEFNNPLKNGPEFVLEALAGVNPWTYCV